MPDMAGGGVGVTADTVWVASLLASLCHRLQEGSWHGFALGFLPSTLLWQQSLS